MATATNTITFRDGCYIADFSFENRAIPKQAGFWWHPQVKDSRCRPNCAACAAGLTKKWWTPFAEKAALLVDHADSFALRALQPHLDKVEASKATDSDRELEAPEGLSYLPYQKAGIAYALNRKGTLIADEMGLGKTIQALGVINNDPKIKSVLVICPASLRLNWLREADKWLLDNFEAYVVDNAGPVPADTTFVIANYDRLKGKTLASIMDREWDCVIVDEAHFLKNEKAKRTQTVLGKRPVWKKRYGQWEQSKPAEPGIIDRAQSRVMFLTGTPILNRPIEAFPLLHALDNKTWRSKSGYAKTYCNAHHNGYGYVDTGCNAAKLPELQERLRSSIMVRRLKKDVLKELPAKRRQVVCLPPNGASAAVKAEQAAFAKHEETLQELREAVEFAELANDKEAYKEAVAALRKGMGVCFEEIAAARKAVAIAKVPKVVEHVESMIESGINKVVVWSHHHEVTDALCEALQARRADGRDNVDSRQAAVDEFQSGALQVLVCGIQAMGTGHTLTAASHVVFAELDWVPANMSQAEDRCHRIGQTESVLVQHLVLDGSLDARMAELLVQKQAIADGVLDASTADKTPLLPSTRKAYPKASDAEREAATKGIQTLARLCDGARTEDGYGFNKLDTNAGKSLAQRSAQRPMTDGEVHFAKKLCNKYRRQLTQFAPQVLGPLGIEA